MEKDTRTRIDVQLGDTLGVLRQIDELGRIVIPVEFRKALNLNNTSDKPWVEIFLINGGIYIRPKKFKYKGE